MTVYFDGLLFQFITTLCLLLFVLVVYINYNYKYWKRQGIMQVTPSFPFGNVRSVLLKEMQLGVALESMHKYFQNRNQKIGGYYFALRPELLLIDPDMVKTILIKDFQYFTDKGLFFDEKNEPLTAHLFSLGGVKWRTLRYKITPAFTSGKMKMMFSTLVATSEGLSNILSTNISEKEPIDVRDISARFTIDAIGSCAFGIDCNSLQDPNAKFRKYGEMAFKPKGMDIVRHIVANLFPNFARFWKIRSMNKDITDFYFNVVKDTIRYRDDTNVSRKDFLQLLIDIKNIGKLTEEDNTNASKSELEQTENKLTVEEIAAQCFVFFMAGFETSATTISFCLYELASNLLIQKKLKEEIADVLEKHNNEITYEAIKEMEYLDKIICETLRKYPTLPFIMRTCSQDYLIPNTKCTIRKGQIVRVAIVGVHKNPEYYPDPERFDPQRFSDIEKSNRPSCTYLPFGEGPRKCIGMKFGLMQTKVGIITMLRHHLFTLHEKTKVPVLMDPKNFVLSPQGGIWLNVHSDSKV